MTARDTARFRIHGHDERSRFGRSDFTETLQRKFRSATRRTVTRTLPCQIGDGSRRPLRKINSRERLSVLRHRVRHRRRHRKGRIRSPLRPRIRGPIGIQHVTARVRGRHPNDARFFVRITLILVTLGLRFTARRRIGAGAFGNLVLRNGRIERAAIDRRRHGGQYVP